MMMHRQITQWYGGMGMVVIAVAVLPSSVSVAWT